jgi:hypothetical protein
MYWRERLKIVLSFKAGQSGYCAAIDALARAERDLRDAAAAVDK